MATTTTNLGLTKPIGTEKALVSVINGNMDIIDNKVGAIPQNESVQSQITALNDQVAKSIIGAEMMTITANSDLNNYTTVGYYTCDNSSRVETLANCPVSAPFVMNVRNNINNNRRIQELTQYNTGNTFIRCQTNATSNTWADWFSAYESLNGLKVIRKTINANSSLTLTCSNSCHAFFIAFGASGARNAWISRQSSNGSPGILALSESSNLTTSVSDTNITFTLASSSNATLYILLLNGEIS